MSDVAKPDAQNAITHRNVDFLMRWHSFIQSPHSIIQPEGLKKKKKVNHSIGGVRGATDRGDRGDRGDTGDRGDRGDRGISRGDRGDRGDRAPGAARGRGISRGDRGDRGDRAPSPAGHPGGVVAGGPRSFAQNK